MSEEVEDDNKEFEEQKDNSIEIEKAILELTGQAERIDSLYF